MERCRHVSSPRPAIGDNFPKGAKSRQMAQLQSHVRYRGSLVSITDVCCRPSTCQLSGEEQAATPEVVFPRAGVFVRHIGNQEVLAKANHVLFFNHLLIRDRAAGANLENGPRIFRAPEQMIFCSNGFA